MTKILKMAATISFIVTSWKPESRATHQLVDMIIRQGVDPKNIHIVDDRISRPISLNRAIARCNSDYIGFCEDDVLPSMNAVETLTRLLDRYPKVGLAAAKVQQLFDERPTTAPIPSMGHECPDEVSLEDISGQMWTLNFVLYRKSTNVLFDEDYFGNQVFDEDFGYELFHHGYSSMVDLRCAVAHQQTDYFTKSLSYHVCVARNRQISIEKWRCRADWQGLHAFEKANRGVIPTIEELTHANEDWQYKYIAKFDLYSLQEFYFRARFGDSNDIENFIQTMRPLLNPKVWESPVVTVVTPP